MKTKNLYCALFIMTFTGMMFSCKKSNSDSPSTATTDTQLKTQSDDQTRVSNESDDAFDDVNTAMTSQYAVTGSSSTPGLRYGTITEGGNEDTVKSLICDAVVTIDTIDNPHTMTIAYNGNNCNITKTRKGSIVISWAPGMRWQTKGATVTVDFQNVAITRLSDNKTITLAGTHTYTNVSGGSLRCRPISPGDSIVH